VWQEAQSEEIGAIAVVLVSEILTTSGLIIDDEYGCTSDDHPHEPNDPTHGLIAIITIIWTHCTASTQEEAI